MIIDFRFQSTSHFHAKGFHIVYKALELFKACGGNYSNSNGVLTSPLHSNTYPDLADCVYLISEPNGTYIKISFITMDVNCQGTPADFIEMRDGNSDKSPVIGRFCGNSSNVPNYMQTTQNFLRIRWIGWFKHNELYQLNITCSSDLCQTISQVALDFS